jgi:hypothetical protein
MRVAVPLLDQDSGERIGWRVHTCSGVSVVGYVSWSTGMHTPPNCPDVDEIP